MVMQAINDMSRGIKQLDVLAALMSTIMMWVLGQWDSRAKQTICMCSCLRAHCEPSSGGRADMDGMHCHGLCTAFMLSVCRERFMPTPSRASQGMDEDFKHQLIQLYKQQQTTNTLSKLFCPVLKRFFPRHLVHATHLFPVRLRVSAGVQVQLLRHHHLCFLPDQWRCIPTSPTASPNGCSCARCRSMHTC